MSCGIFSCRRSLKNLSLSETVVNQVQDSIQVGRIHLSGSGGFSDCTECAGASEDLAAKAADQVGFGDYSSFYRAYVKVVGKAPTAAEA
jgi:hypothetical protein